MKYRMTGNLKSAKKLPLATRLTTLLASILIGVMQAPHLQAQPQPEKPLAFEVASIKLNKSAAPGKFGVAVHPGGKLVAVGTPVYMLISHAYGIVQFQSPRLTGGPDWIRSERYDIEAAAEKSAIPSDLSPIEQRDRLRLMLRTLLADRFHLVIRRETKEIPVYTLSIAKNGPKLQKSPIEEQQCEDVGKEGVRCHAFSGGMGRGLDGKAVTMSDLVAFVENWTDRPLIDRTGIQGLFEIKSECWVPLIPRVIPPGGNDEGFSDPTRPTLYMVFDRLGLKMESQRAPVERYVIESVERPTAN